MNPDLRDLLLGYDELPVEERAAADVHLAAHPDDYTLVEEGRRLRALFQAARPPDPLSDQAVSEYLIALAQGAPPTEDHVAHGRLIAEARRADPAFEARYRALEDRLDELLAALPSPGAHFERLTGLPWPADVAPERDAETPDRASREATAPLRLLRFARPLAAAALFLVALYGGLAVVSTASTPSHERLAALEEARAPIAPPRMRGGETEVTVLAERFQEAVTTMHGARRHTLGLFPRYDAEALDAAAAQLAAIVAADSEDGPLGLEARYLLGRIALHRGAIAQARAAFEAVVARHGPSAPEAAELLRALD